MSKKNEIKIVLEGERIVGVSEINILNGRLSLKVLTEKEEEEVKRIFIPSRNIVLIEASKLSVSDDFMAYQPKNDKEKIFKERLEQAIAKGVKDFYRPVLDPSFGSNGRLQYEFNSCSPAVGKSYEWWENIAKDIMPERKGRLGTKNEYLSFLAVLLKKLINAGWDTEKAWKAICIDSRELGYYPTIDDLPIRRFSWTGRNEVLGFYDLASTSKILSDDEGDDEFFTTRVSIYAKNALADLYPSTSKSYDLNEAVGWIVFEK